jgi:hypothetical protein
MYRIGSTTLPLNNIKQKNNTIPCVKALQTGTNFQLQFTVTISCVKANYNI